MMQTPPCEPTCPSRSPTCHAECSAYLAYSAGQELIRAERHNRWETNHILKRRKKAAPSRMISDLNQAIKRQNDTMPVERSDDHG